MRACWRWFGDGDPLSLAEIRQTGVKDIVAALYERNPGEAWPLDEVRARAEKVREAGLEWTVVESIPVHEDIKKHTGDWRRFVENYKTSLRNVAACGVKTVCYNFMPVLDWTRTDVKTRLDDGSVVMTYNPYEVAAFDVFALKRPGAEAAYDEATLVKAKEVWEKSTSADRERLEKTILMGLPGTVDDLSPAEFLAQVKEYESVGEAGLRDHLYGFLNEITPVLEETGLTMAIHPDDPPYPIFGLPRILSNAADMRMMCEACPSERVGFTLCTGSLGGSLANDEVAMFREFARRIHFCHFRNLVYAPDGVFRESESHLTGKIDMPALMLELLREEKRRGERIFLRPDHGRQFYIDKDRPCYWGYSFVGRMVGLSELRGLELGLRRAYSL